MDYLDKFGLALHYGNKSYREASDEALVGIKKAIEDGADPTEEVDDRRPLDMAADELSDPSIVAVLLDDHRVVAVINDVSSENRSTVLDKACDRASRADRLNRYTGRGESSARRCVELLVSAGACSSLDLCLRDRDHARPLMAYV